MENNNLGQVKISNEVIVTIAGLAALEVENVETITTITDKLLKNNGVKIQIEEDQIILDIYVNIEFGESIPDTAFKIQENVNFLGRSNDNIIFITICYSNINASWKSFNRYYI